MLSANIESAFRNVHERFHYVSDQKKWGRSEYWAGPKESIAAADTDGIITGDCEDFALLCREELNKLGVPNRLALCAIPSGEFHIVCETNGWILDCRYKSVMTANELPYRWISISGYEAGEPWREIV
ncbi:MAG: transglutaminase-like cysteine peptidase [Gallionella sp.]|nr:transglutaminase-like cysteine peptidase [Gallionella sp.]MDD4947212.1 transglutaminase-like cysteine peptidase [Gallionella sp.]MDD5611987.1 transglutaminase-like cysteine peptidase [Gallionella sp.]